MSEILTLENIYKTYPNGHVHALNDINLTIQSGEHIAIMGPSGSGKSTLLNIIGGLDIPSSGSITSNPANIGIVFQSFYLLPNLTALENVQIPMFETALTSSERRKKAEELLDTVGMGHRMNHRPYGLSVGEKQRVAIARALANDPGLLLADEPTGSLDTESTREVLKLFHKLHKTHGVTLIIVTHDHDVAARADRIIHIIDGKLVT